MGSPGTRCPCHSFSFQSHTLLHSQAKDTELQCSPKWFFSIRHFTCIHHLEIAQMKENDKRFQDWIDLPSPSTGVKNIQEQKMIWGRMMGNRSTYTAAQEMDASQPSPTHWAAHWLASHPTGQRDTAPLGFTPDPPSSCPPCFHVDTVIAGITVPKGRNLDSMLSSFLWLPARRNADICAIGNI